MHYTLFIKYHIIIIKFTTFIKSCYLGGVKIVKCFFSVAFSLLEIALFVKYVFSAFVVYCYSFAQSVVTVSFAFWCFKYVIKQHLYFFFSFFFFKLLLFFWLCILVVKIFVSLTIVKLFCLLFYSLIHWIGYGLNWTIPPKFFWVMNVFTILTLQFYSKIVLLFLCSVKFCPLLN